MGEVPEVYRPELRRAINEILATTPRRFGTAFAYYQKPSPMWWGITEWVFEVYEDPIYYCMTAPINDDFLFEPIALAPEKTLATRDASACYDRCR
jgi:hypothetical protein